MDLWNADEIVPMREHVYRYLKQMILEGRCSAGDRLIERDLANQLKISRTPIREALFRLEAQGLVHTVPRKGVVVSSISAERIIEIFDILTVLVGLAAERAADRIDEKTAEECGQWMKNIETFIEDGDYGQAVNFHLSVCYFLYGIAKSPKLNQMLRDLTDYIQAFASTSYKKENRLIEAMSEHRMILDAIKRGDKETAKNRAVTHIQHSRSAYLQSIASKKQ